MDAFTPEEQQFFFETFLAKSKKTGLSVTTIQNNFLFWYNQVKQINPCTLKEEEIQPLIDLLLNTKDGGDIFQSISGGFFHTWWPSLQLPFLKLTQSSSYCESVDTMWRIDWDDSPNASRYVVNSKLSAYFTKDEFAYLRGKIEYVAKQLGLNSYVLFVDFQKWFFAIKEMDICNRTEDEIRQRIDHYLNSETGRANMKILNNETFSFMTKEHFMEFYQLTRFQKRNNDKPGFWIEFDFETEKYVFAKTKK
ncbi:MAG: hypothetical protein Barrevirus19_8 [Barrevirus sp.]|uniref:Uncharacterized protein n=1 Tax=Barrevirus sp. TaxID=2487763 RepID=A0A3G4ZUE0_9VIRU|nr:MAG: hypothetical protein Barrevirus19_8 [Barrevirus sp.]